MEDASRSAAELRAQIARAEQELKDLKEQLARVEEQEKQGVNGGSHENPSKWPLKPDEYERYARQLILSSVGIQGQLRLKSSSVLVVGAGGLGCPAAAYLAGAGVGTIGIVDGDTVEVSNVHRQIAHTTSRVGMSKVDSLIAYLKDLNPLSTYNAHRSHLTATNAEEIVSQYDVVLDCTDHPTSRYLISDICVLLCKPLVSASALRTDGQLIVFNCPPAPQGASGGGPCYRCVWPNPPPPESIVSCGEGGILGPAVGVMGVLQALEGIRIIASGRHVPPAENGSPEVGGTAVPVTLLLFSATGISPPAFKSARMRGRRKDCFACGALSALTLETLANGWLDYVQFCGGAAGPVSLLAPEERVSAREYSEICGRDEGAGGEGRKHLLLDVREKELFEMGSIEGAVNVPFSRILGVPGREGASAGGIQPEWLPPGLGGDEPIYVVCRVGNDSQLVSKRLKDLGLGRDGERFIGDIRGGMRAWKAEIDVTLPFI